MNSIYQTSVFGPLHDLYVGAIGYVPNLIAAVVVLIVGWIIGIFLGKLVQKALEAVKIDYLANQLGMQTLAQRVERTLSIAALGGWIVKWFFFLGSIIAAADILQLSGVSSFLYAEVIPYAGHVVVAMAILLIGILTANFLSGLVHSSVKAGGFQNPGVLSTLTRWSIIVFTLIATLSQLQIATFFLQDLFRAVVAMFAIAGGLAFGLGGKEHAKRVLDSVESNFNKRV